LSKAFPISKNTTAVDILLKFGVTWSADKQTARWSHKPLFIFQNKKNRLKMRDIHPCLELELKSATLVKIVHTSDRAVTVTDAIIIQFNSIQFNSCLFTCKLNSSDANYKVSTRT
jgi:hypothetical protein